MNAELLAGIVGILISLACSYIPGLRVKWAALEADVKRAVMLGMLVVVAGSIFGLQCANVLDFGLTCDRVGAIALVKIFIAALIGNQAAYSITPLPADTKAQ